VKATATKALELDENLVEPHVSLANAAFEYDWNWQEAEKEFKRAISLNPNYAKAHGDYGIYLDTMGRFDEALLQHNRAQELEPTSMPINTDRGVHYYAARQYEQAAKQLTTTLEMDPNYAFAHYVLGLVYLQKSSLGNAVAELQKAVDLERGNPEYIAYLGLAYARAGNQRDASKILAELQELSKHRYVSPASMAPILLYIGGKQDEGFEALEKGYEDHYGYMCWLKVDQIFNPFRSDPRFQALLRRMNFPER
jgi:Flp pilus assembly protein TadD